MCNYVVIVKFSKLPFKIYLNISVINFSVMQFPHFSFKNVYWHVIWTINQTWLFIRTRSLDEFLFDQLFLLLLFGTSSFSQTWHVNGFKFLFKEERVTVSFLNNWYSQIVSFFVIWKYLLCVRVCKNLGPPRARSHFLIFFP